VNESPFILASQLQAHINGVVSAMDINAMDLKPRKVMTDLGQYVAEARLDTRDYELSETRDEQLKHAAVAKKRLAQVRKNILAASEYDIFGAVDVAQLTGTVDHIIERIE
jgi:hypothetical protein